MISPNDESSLTAYALGELSGAERAAVAAHLAGNPRARQFVAEARATAHLLGDELARESFGGLTDLQHAAIEQKLADAMRMPRRPVATGRNVFWNRAVLGMSVAASVLIVGGVVSVLLPFVYHRMQVALQPPPPGNQNVHPFQIAVDKTGSMSRLPGAVATRTDSPRDPKLAGNEPEETPPDDPWVPQPDNRLVASDSGNEELRQPQKLIVVPTPHDVKEVPAPVVAHGPAESPKAPATPGAARENVAANRPRVKPADNFAKLPIDQPAPDKLSASVGSAANGTLPTGEQYAHLLENPYIDTASEPLSGFSAGVDTASYSNIRRFLTHGKLPPPDAVRIEEMLNYFPVRATEQAGEGPLTLQVELGACPWRPDRRLARVCVMARELSPLIRPPVNLVFVIDISDSMRKEKSRLPLLKQAIRQLTGRLSARDRISIVAYSREPGVVLAPTAADDKTAIWSALDRLEGGGQIVGGQGIEAGYDLARRNVSPFVMSRLILATDGNWQIGTTSRAELASIVREKARHQDISLTVLGVGMENLKDATLQKLASAGNGSYAYIDTPAEAKKALADQVNGSLVTVARNVKVQVAFNPAAADSYRLIGYERRALSSDELRSQSRPGGELGAGQSVTALYEVIPTVKSSTAATRPAEMLTAVVSYVDATTRVAARLSATGEDHATPLPRTSAEFRFAAAVAEFGLLLRNSDYKGNATYAGALDHAREAYSIDEMGYRAEFLKLIQRAKALSSGR